MKSIRRHLLISLLVGLTLLLSAGGVALFLRVRAILTSEFDRAERYRAALTDLQASRAWRLACRLRAWLQAVHFWLRWVGIGPRGPTRSERLVHEPSGMRLQTPALANPR